MMTISSWTINEHSFVFLATLSIIPVFMLTQTLTLFFIFLQEKKGKLFLFIFIIIEMDITV